MVRRQARARLFAPMNGRVIRGQPRQFVVGEKLEAITLIEGSFGGISFAEYVNARGGNADGNPVRQITSSKGKQT